MYLVFARYVFNLYLPAGIGVRFVEVSPVRNV